MTTEVVLSPVKDEKIKVTLGDSPIWKNAFKPEEVTDLERMKYHQWYTYTFKFDGLKVSQCTKFKTL